MFKKIMDNVVAQINEAEVLKAKNNTKELLIVAEGIQFNMIAFDQKN